MTLKKQIKDLKPGETFYDSLNMPNEVQKVIMLDGYLKPTCRVHLKTKAGSLIFQNFKAEREVEVELKSVTVDVDFRGLLIIVFMFLFTGCASQPQQPLTEAQRQFLIQNYRPIQSYQLPVYQMPISRPTTTQTHCTNMGYGQINCTSY